MFTLHITPEMRRKLEAALAEKGRCRLAAMSFSATAFLALDLLAEFRRTVVVVADSMHSLDELRRNLLALSGTALAGVHPERILYYPAWESLPGREDGLPSVATNVVRAKEGHQKQATVQTEVVGERLQTLERLIGLQARCRLQAPVVIATCVQALMQMTLSPTVLKVHTFRVALGEEHDPEMLAKRLEQTGYAFEPEVQAKGQAAWRGGLLDVWALNEAAPFRIEFVGATVETIRSFDPASQRSFARLPGSAGALRPGEKEAVLPPVNEWNMMRSGTEARCLFMNYLPPELIYLWSEPVTVMPQLHGRLPKLYHPSGDVSTSAVAQGAMADTSLDMTHRTGHSELKRGISPVAGRPAGIRYHAAIYQEALDEAKVSDLTIPFASVHRVITENPRAWQCLPDPVFESTYSVERQALPACPAEAASRRGKRFLRRQGYGGQVAQASEAASVDQADMTDETDHQIDWPPPAPHVDLGFRSVTELAAPHRDLLAPDIFAEHRRQWLASLAERTRPSADGLRVHIFFYTQGALDRFRELNPEPAFHLHVGMLSDGFMQVDLQLAVLSESNLLGRPKLLPDRTARTTARVPTSRRVGASAGETITDWTNLEPGDFVVHVDHGIGHYLGLYEIMFDGKRQEALTIEYADKAKLYVPVSQAHLLSRYVGVGKHAPSLHRLGSARWPREKDAAERAVRDLAADLLEIQAAREAKAGIAFPPDTPWQNEFEASFPYQETEDQERAIHDVKRDMETSRPMDRLVCGDVGYGKTEVAMRAAFKCVMSGKQVAMLVPTTVLAQQHYEVFAERMAAYPMRVELLCRFRTLPEQADVVRALFTGGVDIVIGTHRLIQPDVRFKDLGLVIIDEEQRFGVGHKERFKHLQQLVDVLTLTATPIPRTLYMSLTGAKEISVIQTSPRARQAIETIVAKNDDRVIRDAILRELNRGGQIYYLHNRVHSIERVRERLEKLVPEARMVVGHGQMPTSVLSHIIRDFARGDYDLLLCTTIIESGIDIPNVNTILIDRADRFGMADLYQLRGRVGRSSRKAYAYMLLPVHGHLLDTSRQRIQAILEHTELGAGFRLAMRDLEIRGAGNLLGPEQSGHIAAIGFDLYCQLLRHTIAQMSKTGATALPTRIVHVEVKLDFIDLSTQAADPAHSAFLPVAYVEDERLRISVYRQIASAMTLAEIAGLREEFRDRFGPLPPPLDRLLKIAGLRILAAEKKITLIEVQEGKLILHRHEELLQIKNRFPRLRAAGVDAQLDEIQHWLRRVEDKGFRQEW
ncbi:MAG: transcription-repair coupling factor [Verrucomicrobia bacterium]|nr:transcription-repair coupling factor [Verrucomicrobiota bacterium]MBU1735019.1 transcription-repair coupling factor [Verrucomicrobiota bacterium]MBU1856043.1 transcription-repair coupling factor [Verrucomicrobiota bacterium]